MRVIAQALGKVACTCSFLALVTSMYATSSAWLPLADRSAPDSGQRADVAASFPDQAQMLDGDLVFRRGRDLVADLVLSKEASGRFSHVGVVVFLNSDAMVVHAMPGDDGQAGGVRLEPLAQFLSASLAADAAVMRESSLKASQRQAIRARALALVGTPFDFDLRFSDDSQMYCTELAIKVFQAADIDLYSKVEHTRFLTVSEDIVSPDALSRLEALQPI